MDVDKLVPEAGNLEGFIEQFPVFAGAPNGIEKIRSLILELAVRGKLNTQNTNDVPASFLLEKITIEKAKLVKEGTVKKQKPLPNINEVKKPFLLPKGWLWVRLFDIGNTNIGLTYSPNDISSTGIPVLRSTNIQNGKLDLLDLVRVEKEIKNSVIVQNGDLLICARNGSKALVGKTAMIKDLEEQMAFGAFMAIFRSECNKYVEVFLKSPVFREFLEGVSTTTINQITQNNLKSTLIPLPPVEEQKRIVVKVDELMALCDKLEAQQQQQANNLLRANTAAINALLNPEPQHTEKNKKTSATVSDKEQKANFEQNWQRIAQHFNTLYGCTLPMPKGEGRKKKHLVGLENVKALRQVILQLAITGKLVSQNSSDNSANSLVESIKAQKTELLKAKLINKQSVFPAIPDQDKLFNEPAGWIFVRLGEITNRIGSGSTPRGGKSAYTETGIPFFRSQNIWNNGLKLQDVAYIPESTHEKMSNTAIYAKDILLNITGASLGRCTLISDNFEHGNVSQHVTIIRATEPETRKFLHLCILSPYTQNMIWKRQVGMAREGLSKKVLEQFEIPLPPLKEQKRIVAKVGQLMTLCDQLEQQLTQSYSDAEKLMQATVKALVA